MNSRLGEFTELIATQAAPASGSAAAMALAMGAGLAQKVVSRSPNLRDQTALGAQAQMMRDRALELIVADEHAVKDMLRRGMPGPQAVAVPQQIGEVAGDLDALASRLIKEGNPGLEADSLGALQLAQAAKKMTDAILQSNST